MGEALPVSILCSMIDVWPKSRLEVAKISAYSARSMSNCLFSAGDRIGLGRQVNFLELASGMEAAEDRQR